MSASDKPVVVGIDGCPGSVGALHFAVTEAARRHARLLVVHVVPLMVPAWTAPATTVFPELRATARALLRQALDTVRAVDPSVHAGTRLVHGSPAAGLVDNAEDAQLTVVGRETQHGLERVLFGATALAVASRAASPVAVVPETWREDQHDGRIVVGLKDRTNAHELLGCAFDEARARGGSVRAVTAWNLADPYLDSLEARTQATAWEAEATEVIAPLVSGWQSTYPDVPVDFEVKHGPAASVLLTESKQSDLLIVSRRRHLLPPYGHLGVTAHRVLLLAQTPVLVVPHTGSTSLPEHVLWEETDAAPA